MSDWNQIAEHAAEKQRLERKRNKIFRAMMLREMNSRGFPNDKLGKIDET